MLRLERDGILWSGVEERSFHKVAQAFHSAANGGTGRAHCGAHRVGGHGSAVSQLVMFRNAGNPQVAFNRRGDEGH